MNEQLSNVAAWFRPIGEFLGTRGILLLELILNVLELLIRVIPGLLLWGFLILGPLVAILAILVKSTEQSVEMRFAELGVIGRTCFFGIVLVSLAAVTVCSLMVGGLGKYTWLLVDQAWPVADSAWLVWLKNSIGFIAALSTIAFCCGNSLAGELLSSVYQSIAKAWRKSLIVLSGSALLLGFVWPVAFEYSRGEYLKLGNQIAGNLNRDKIPDQLKGAVFQGTLTGSTHEGRIYGYFWKQDMIIAFGNKVPFVSVDGSPLPCRVEGQTIIVPTFRKQSMWLDLSFDSVGGHLFYKLRSNTNNDTVITEGVLDRQTRTVTDGEMMNQLLKELSLKQALQEFDPVECFC